MYNEYEILQASFNTIDALAKQAEFNKTGVTPPADSENSGEQSEIDTNIPEEELTDQTETTAPEQETPTDSQEVEIRTTDGMTQINLGNNANQSEQHIVRDGETKSIGPTF